MRTRLIGWWHAAQESLWALPGGVVLACALLALTLVEVDRALALSHRGGRLWVFGGGAEGARGVLEAIAGSLITVTGTVFSITIVTLQLASTQFTPRVLRTFTRDRGVQAVLGVFIGTFTYCLLVLRSVRSQSSDGAQFVPGVSVVVAILLALASVGFLIYFIHHMAHAIRVTSVLEHVTADGRALIDRRFPDGTGEPASGDSTPAGDPAIIPATTSGYLHFVAIDALFNIAIDRETTIRAEKMVGDFVLAGESLALVWPNLELPDDFLKRVEQEFVLGRERTLEQDVELPFRQLADIAVKALSPGVNDPTTAVTCIDRLAELILSVARRGAPAPSYERANSPIRLIIPVPSFEKLCGTAFAQIGHFGAGDEVVAVHLMDTLGRLQKLVSPGCRSALIEQGQRLLMEARGQNTIDWPHAELDMAAAWLPMETRTAALVSDKAGGHVL